MLLQDKIVVISGASSGIGAATARIFARHKAHVVLLARTETALKTVAQQIGNASYYPVDLRHFEAVALAQDLYGSGINRNRPYEIS